MSYDKTTSLDFDKSECNCCRQWSTSSNKINAPHNSNWRLASDLAHSISTSYACEALIRSLMKMEMKTWWKINIQLLGANPIWLPTYIHKLKLLCNKIDFLSVEFIDRFAKIDLRRATSLNCKNLWRSHHASTQDFSELSRFEKLKKLEKHRRVEQQQQKSNWKREMMSKEYLINEAHQLDHQTTILNKLDTHTRGRRSGKSLWIHIQIGSLFFISTL